MDTQVDFLGEMAFDLNFGYRVDIWLLEVRISEDRRKVVVLWLQQYLFLAAAVQELQKGKETGIFFGLDSPIFCVQGCNARLNKWK